MNSPAGRGGRAVAAGRLAFSVMLAVAAVSVGPVAAATAVVQPHRALYAVSLERASESSDVIGVTGRMGFEWRDDCDGWSIDQRYVMDFSRVDGDGFTLRSRYTTWESKAGDFYRFVVERDRGGEVERVEGRASMPLPLGSNSGEARFSSPEKLEIALGSGTLFPSLHTVRLLEAATGGRRFLRARVFDGSELEPPFLISAVIGERRENAAPIDAPEAQGPFWPARLAWFPSEGTDAEPDFEMTVELLHNGIARSLRVDYGDFTIRMVLEELEALPTPARC